MSPQQRLLFKKICEVRGMDPDLMLEKKRNCKLRKERQTIFYLFQQLSGMGVARICKEKTLNREETAIYKAVDWVKSEMAADRIFKQKLYSDSMVIMPD
jgi:chromosomal replication initiation ATPase DnaA